MKELYTTPNMEIITFSTEDIITTSMPVANEIPELPFDEL